MIIDNPEQLLEMIEYSLDIKKEKLRLISVEQKQLEIDIIGLENTKLKLLNIAPPSIPIEKIEDKPTQRELREVKKRFTREGIINFIEVNGPVTLVELGLHYQVRRLNAFACLNIYKKHGMLQKLQDGRWAGMNYKPMELMEVETV